MADDPSTLYDLLHVIPPTPSDDPDTIVGGAPTRQFPDCCAVGDSTGYYCSGTLIARTVVVTAKHCKRIGQVFLKGGDIRDPSSGEMLTVCKTIEHPKVDLRLLILERESQVAPRHIAQEFEVQATRAELVGFGTIDYDGMLGYGLKRRVEVPIVSIDGTDPHDQENYNCLPNVEMVAGQRGLNRDSCRGDSGGPLYIMSPEGEYYLLGVTSRGISNTHRRCGDGGIYVRLDRFVDWIRTQTGVTIEGPRL
jgi:hypothetical protein